MSYISAMLEPSSIRKMVKKTVAAIISAKLNYEAIAVRGNSGVLIDAPLAIALKKPIIVIRKSDQNAHSDRAIEYPEMWANVYPKLNVILIDDGVCRGDTVDACIRACKEANITIVGAFMYNQRVINRDPDLQDFIRSKGWSFKVYTDL